MPSSSAAPATSSRGRGGKFKKYTRGGGRHFSRDLQPADAEGNKVSMWSADAQHSDEDDDDSEEESSDEDVSKATPAADASREDRKAQKKAKKQAAIAKSQAHTVEVGDMPSSDEEDSDDDGMLANPNHSKAARKQTAPPARGGDVEEITEGVAKMNAPGNRKEREAVAAQAAKERYMKLQAEGKTDQAKADLARLKLIREQRAAEAERRQAEKEEKEAQDKVRKAEIEAREKKLREAAAAPKKSKKK